MRRLLHAGAAALLLTLGACTSAATPAPVAEPEPVAPAVPDESTPPEVAAPGPMGRFVAAVRQQLPELAMDRRDEEVAQIGEQTCDALAAGKKSATVLGEIEKFGVAGADARTLLGLAKRTACRG